MSDTALLSIEHLKKAYGDNVVLEDISLSVKRGEVIVVIGPSGCGKSTFLRCINALEPIQGGTIEVDGKEVTSSPSFARKLAWCSRATICSPI